ncbi:hypothetical protein [Acidithiobacillus acidisediminis]|uniref:hypothetical protein n=1 Tax=Acidithiobacillus TaxID=119977 RepID=UPI0020100BDB|nr:hypothetical protein [Acidithiobacillus sp. S30A2]MCL5051942.1 hypothetical protein [Gammaproteobacteria bacterium]
MEAASLKEKAGLTPDGMEAEESATVPENDGMEATKKGPGLTPEGMEKEDTERAHAGTVDDGMEGEK